MLSEAAQLQIVRTCLAQLQAGAAEPRAVLRAMLSAEGEGGGEGVGKGEGRGEGEGGGGGGGGGEGELRALAAAVAPLYVAACRDAASGLRAKVEP